MLHCRACAVIEFSKVRSRACWHARRLLLQAKHKQLGYLTLPYPAAETSCLVFPDVCAGVSMLEGPSTLTGVQEDWCHKHTHEMAGCT